MINYKIMVFIFIFIIFIIWLISFILFLKNKFKNKKFDYNQQSINNLFNIIRKNEIKIEKLKKRIFKLPEKKQTTIKEIKQSSKQVFYCFNELNQVKTFKKLKQAIKFKILADKIKDLLDINKYFTSELEKLIKLENS